MSPREDEIRDFSKGDAKCVGESQGVLTVLAYEREREVIYDNKALNKHIMFRESKLTLLI